MYVVEELTRITAPVRLMFEPPLHDVRFVPRRYISFFERNGFRRVPGYEPPHADWAVLMRRKTDPKRETTLPRLHQPMSFGVLTEDKP